MKAKAVSYLRVSGKAQVDGDGFERQRTAIAKFCKASKYELVEEFSDGGVSGTTDLENRPGLAALLDRDLMVSEIILDQLTKAGAKMLAADGVDLTTEDDPTRTLIRQVLAAVSQFDKAVVVLKLRAARERLRRKGHRVEGRKPYGHRPDEKLILEHMRSLRAKPRGSVSVIRKSPTDSIRKDTARGMARLGRRWASSRS